MEKEESLALTRSPRVDARAPRPDSAAHGGAAGETLPALFERAVAKGGERVALREKRLGIWTPISWREWARRAREIGLGLVALGLEPGEIACILSGNKPEWLFAELGILGAAGASAGIYPTSSAAALEKALHDTRAKFLFVEDEEQLDKALSVRGRCPELRKIIVFDMKGLWNFSDEMVMSLDALTALAATLGDAEGVWRQRQQARAADDLALVVYGAGSGGRPRGAMLSHRNVALQATHGAELLPTRAGEDRLCLLSLCHVTERVHGLYQAIVAGTVLNFAEGPDTVLENLRELQPTTLAAVPRLWEKLNSTVTIAIADATGLEKRAYRWALAAGKRVAARRARGEAVLPWLAGAAALGRLLVLSNVRRTIGADGSRRLLTSSAPIAADLVRWYAALGLEMVEMYALTETAGAIAVTPAQGARSGTTGRVVPHAELRLSEAGEILVRGDMVFLGYLGDAEATAAVLHDGWLHTGDAGTIDPDGFVTIRGRMTDIFETADGRTVEPAATENALKLSPYVSDAVVVGAGRDALACLVALDHDNAIKYAQENGVAFTHFQSLCRAPEMRTLIAGEIARATATLPQAGRIRGFRIIDRPLSVEAGELTPMLGLNRRLVEERHAALVEEIYADAG